MICDSDLGEEREGCQRCAELPLSHPHRTFRGGHLDLGPKERNRLIFPIVIGVSWSGQRTRLRSGGLHLGIFHTSKSRGGE